MAKLGATRPPALVLLLSLLFIPLSTLPMPSEAVPMGATLWTPLSTGQQPVQSLLQTTSQVSGSVLSDALNRASAAAHEKVHKLEKGLYRGLAEVVSNAIGAGGGGTDVVAITLFVFLLSASMVIGHLMEEVKWLNESVTAVIFGLVSGGVVLWLSNSRSSHILRFDEELFFIYLLPPIIFNAGFQVKKKQFFRNFGGIMIYGVLGVFISVAVIAVGCSILFPALGLPAQSFQVYLVLGVIFSATDSVCTLQVLDQDEQPLLYSLVFGEGVVNDATSVVLFYAMSHLTPGGGPGGDLLPPQKLLEILVDFLYLFTTSTALGVALGLASAFLIKTLYFGRHSTDREIALMVLMAYQSYVIAELLHLSGILAVFFCGIVMSHYTWHNVTESSRVTTKHSFATMSYIAETFIFIYLGMDALDWEKYDSISFSTVVGMFGIFLALILLGRAAFVFPLSFIINQYRKRRLRITLRHQFVIWWSGLMRGAVSIALVYRATSEFESGMSGDVESATAATMSVVLFSTLVFGSLTRPIIDLMVPHSHLDRSTSLLTDRGSTPNHLSFRGGLDTPFLQGKPPLEDSVGGGQEKQEGGGGQGEGSVGQGQGEGQGGEWSRKSGDEQSRKSKEGRDGEGGQARERQGHQEQPGAQGEGSWSARGGSAHGVPNGESSHSGHSQQWDRTAVGPVPMPSTHLVGILTGRERDLHDWWRWFDDSYMRPYFGGRGFMPVLPPSPTVSVHDLEHTLSIRRLSMRANGPFAEGVVFNETDEDTGTGRAITRLELGGDALEGRHLADEDPAWPVDNGENKPISEGVSRNHVHQDDSI